MLNRIIIAFLLTCIVGTYLSRDFAVLSFELNQRYIAEELCVNRDKPWMHCNGKCYLMNKVKQAEENEKKQAGKDLRTHLQIVWNLQPLPLRTAAALKYALPQRFRNDYAYFYTSQYHSSIFRPPKV